jgi:hypothetical protein
VNWWAAGAIALAVLLIVIASRLGWIDFSNKNRSSGTAGGAMGIGDEVFNPQRHEAQIELDRQTILPAPAPLAGDGDKGIFNGRIRINLDDDRRG